VITRAQKLTRQLHEAPVRVLALVLWRLVVVGVMAGCATHDHLGIRCDTPRYGLRMCSVDLQDDGNECYVLYCDRAACYVWGRGPYLCDLPQARECLPEPPAPEVGSIEESTTRIVPDHETGELRVFPGSTLLGGSGCCPCPDADKGTHITLACCACGGQQ